MLHTKSHVLENKVFTCSTINRRDGHIGHMTWTV